MTLRQHLDALIAQASIMRDPGQDAGIAALDTLLESLTVQKKDGLLGFLQKRQDDKVEGVYLHGPVGRGKTFLMDAFLALLPDHVRVMRTHFHRFMLDVHAFNHQFKQDQKS